MSHSLLPQDSATLDTKQTGSNSTLWSWALVLPAVRTGLAGGARSHCMVSSPWLRGQQGYTPGGHVLVNGSQSSLSTKDSVMSTKVSLGSRACRPSGSCCHPDAQTCFPSQKDGPSWDSYRDHLSREAPLTWPHSWSHGLKDTEVFTLIILFCTNIPL